MFVGFECSQIPAGAHLMRENMLVF